MTDVTPQPEAFPAAPELLRQAREAAGLHIAALAASLKVPVRKLEALEAGRYDELPDLTFARALASSACRHLKVDPAPVLAQIPHKTVAALDQVGAINAPFKPGTDEPASSPWGWLSRPAVLVAIVLLLGAVVIVFMPSIGTQPAAPVMPPAATADEPASSQEPEPPAAPGTVTETLAVTPAPVSATVPLEPTQAPAAPPATTLVPTAPAAVATPAPAVPTPAVAAGTPTLSITTKADTWLEVTSPGGTVLVKRMLKAGESVEFAEPATYSVLLGRADGAEVKVRGRAFDLAPFVRNSVARFEVK
jgi:cytoskeleton protein RodZ